MKLSDVYDGDLVLIKMGDPRDKENSMYLDRIEQRQLFIYLRDKFNCERKKYILKLMDDGKFDNEESEPYHPGGGW